MYSQYLKAKSTMELAPLILSELLGFFKIYPSEISYLSSLDLITMIKWLLRGDYS